MNVKARQGHHTLRWVAVAIAVLLVAAACSPADDGAQDEDGTATEGDTDDESSDDAVDEADDTSTDAAGGADELIIAIPEEFPTLATPWGYQAQTALVLRNIHEPLIDRDPETAEFIPALATDWEQIDEITWRFTLREGVTFHDGSEFNAEAAAFSINDTYAEENRGETEYAPINSRASIGFQAEVVDEYILDIVSQERNPLVLGHLFTAGISSMEQLQESPDTFDSEPVGTGAYRFVEWDRGSSYTIETNEEWWGWEADAVPFSPSFDRVTFIIRPEISSRIAAVQAGEAHFAWDLPAEECQSQLGDQCLAAPNPTVSYVRIDTPHPTLGDPRVKEALAISIDREGIGEALLGGSPPASQLDVEGAFGFVDDIEPFEYDPDRAEELLAEAASDGVDLDVELELFGRIASYSGDEQVLEVLQNSWNAIGLNVNAQMMESAAYNDLFVGGADTYVEGRAGLFSLRWPNDLFDVGRTVESQTFCPGAVNIECQAEMDERGRAAMDLPNEERGPAMQDLMRDFNKDMEFFMFMPLNELQIFHGISSDVDWSPRPDIWLYAREFSPS